MDSAGMIRSCNLTLILGARRESRDGSVMVLLLLLLLLLLLMWPFVGTTKP